MIRTAALKKKKSQKLY